MLHYQVALTLLACATWQGYKFFVKATLVQVNGYAQCATTYWSPDGRDLSVNEVPAVCTRGFAMHEAMGRSQTMHPWLHSAEC